MRPVKRTLCLRTVQYVIDRRLQLSKPFRDLAADVIAAPGAFKRRVSKKAAARLTGITRPPAPKKAVETSGLRDKTLWAVG